MNSPLAPSATAIIDELKGELGPILAENGQSFDRLRTVFMIAVQQNPDILKCTPESLRREISKCAADGLVPDSKEAVLLPYYDRDAKAHLANYQPMVHGVIKRLREMGGVFQIVCNLVYANDVYEENEADPDSLVHRSPGFGQDRGAIVGGYVIFRDQHRRVMHFEKMSRADFDKVRQASKSPNSPAWKVWEPEMFRKAVLRRGSKYLSINNDRIRTLIERTDTMFDLNAPPAIERVDPFSGRVIDHDGGRAALAHNPGAAMDTGAREAERVENRTGDQARRQEVHDGAGDGREQTQETARKKADLPEKPPELPDVSVKTEDVEKAAEVLSKVLRVANEHDLDPGDRRKTLKDLVPAWKQALPDYLHPVLKACIDTTDWAIRSAADGKGWMGDHAAFVFKVKSMLGVEKLNVGKYP